MKILYIGTQEQKTGYGISGAGYINALKKAGYEVISFDYFNTKNKIDEKFDIVIYHCPVEWLPRLYIPNIPCYVITTFEADKFPKHWVKILEKYKPIAVIVPSEFNKRSLEKDYTGDVFVIPHVVTEKKVTCELIKKRFIKTALENNPFIFYFIGEWNVRKNIETLIKAYLHAFQENENVLLVLKLKKERSEDFLLFKKIVEKMRSAMNAENSPKIYVLFDNLSDDEIQSLHEFGNCYVSAHRSEGFGLPIAEAMLAENHIIVTGYSGNLQFCNEYNSNLVSYRKTFVYGQTKYDFWRAQYKPDMQWADVDALHFSDTMKKVYKDKDADYLKCKKDLGIETIHDFYNVVNIGMMFKELINDDV